MARKLLKIFGTGILLYFVAKQWVRTGGEEVFVEFSFTSLVMAFFCATGTLLLRVWRWVCLCKAADGNLSRYNLMTSYLSSTLYGVATIGRVGELWKVKHLRDEGIDINHAVALVVFERAFDMLLLVLFAVFSLGIIFGAKEVLLVPATCFVVALVMGTVGLVYHRERLMRLARTSIVVFGMTVSLGRMMDSLLIVLRKPWNCLEVSLWSLCGWGLYFGAMMTLAFGLGVNLSSVRVLAAGSLGALSAAVPATWNGLGLREVVFVKIVDTGTPAQAITISLGFFLVFLSTSLVWGLIGYVVRRQTSQASRWSHTVDVGKHVPQRSEL